MGELIGYIRVSTIDQDTGRQDQMMKELKISPENTFREKISGKDTNRPELQRMLSYIRKGDIVVVESISRLARNTKDLLDIVEKITAKGAGLRSLKESIDTTTPAGQFMLTVFGAMAQLERDYILSRQKEGIEVHKERDRKLKEQGLPAETYKGRKRIPFDAEKLKRELEKVKAGEQTHEETARNLGFIDKNGKLQIRTYFRRVKELQEQETEQSGNGRTITVKPDKNGHYNIPKMGKKDLSQEETKVLNVPVTETKVLPGTGKKLEIVYDD